MSTQIDSTTAINPRAERGLALAVARTITRTEKGWIVPSQSGKGNYVVSASLLYCSCPDFELRKGKCKHIYAVEFVICNRAQDAAKTPVPKPKRPTYPQNWPAYNAAQTNEKAMFMDLLHDLCQDITEPEQTQGRPRLPLADMLFCTAFKVYTTVSTRRCMSDLKDAFRKGYISKAPHYNSICNYLDMPELTPILHQLITTSSLPLKAVEVDFAVDSSGFTTSNYVSWYNTRYGHEQDNHDWIKAHLMTGVKTNVVTSVEISGRYGHDAPRFKPLVRATARNFKIREASADKAYSSRDNLEEINRLGGTPYIPFKTSTTGQGKGSVLWNKLWHFYNYHRDEFLSHYHKRSNVESTFWMIKSKFGTRLRSKTDVAVVNEALCKVLCHNICVVIQSMFELGIDPTFWADSQSAQKAA
jgi:transposase